MATTSPTATDHLLFVNYTKMFNQVGREIIASQIVGLDIGGANLKAALWRDVDQVEAAAINFPMWKQPERLCEGVQHLLHKLNASQLRASSHLAVTMTGELADCFSSREEGVRRIVDALAQVVPQSQLSIYSFDGGWASADQARADPWSVAASNWHALATWLACWPPTAFAFDRAILVDIGSTTADVLPIAGHRLLTTARTDRERLTLGQLLYTGLRRTPVCAITPSLSLEGHAIPVMAELFATVDDAYLLLELVEADNADSDTADGRPRTKPYAAARLARMVGEDACRLSQLQLVDMASQIIDAQATQVAGAIERNLALLGDSEAPSYIVCCGHGLPLFDRAIRKIRAVHRTAYVSQFAPEEVSRCGPAAAVAWLWHSEHGSPVAEFPPRNT